MAADGPDAISWGGCGSDLTYKCADRRSLQTSAARHVAALYRPLLSDPALGRGSRAPSQHWSQLCVRPLLLRIE